MGRTAVTGSGSARRPLAAALAWAVFGALLVATGGIAGAAAPGEAAVPSHGPRCPWVAASIGHRASPAALARQVTARMSLDEKLGMLVLRYGDGYENVDDGVPRLCIPPLTLSDGADGISFGTPGATELPASIGVAASFDPVIAYDYGRVLGAEARTKGIDVVQAPELNLARVPESGRIFEAYGEDPTLTAAMGVAEVEGIQSEGVMADATHFSAYNEETARSRLDQVVPARALAELYDAPFEAAVEQGHAASVMCAYGELDGVNDCSDPALYRLLASWGFSGFVRSDLASVRNPVAAFRAGLDLLKPGSVGALASLVARHELPVTEIDHAVETVLREMFAFGLVAHPVPLVPGAPADTPARVTVARRVAERSMVLLRDERGVLPLGHHLTSLALIGTGAASGAGATGFGSARVLGASPVTPLQGLEQALPRTRFRYAAGGPAGALPPVGGAELVAGRAPPVGRAAPGGAAAGGTGDLGVASVASLARSLLTAGAPGHSRGWSSWRAVLAVPRSGLYELSLGENGDTWLFLGGRQLAALRGLHGRGEWSSTLRLGAGRRYVLRLEWYQVAGERPPRLGLADVSPEIAAAARAARSAQVAVVFADDWTTEGVDRPGLALPGDADALISAVAAANHRTVVVLDTGGAVLMPWIGRVAGLLEAWYPGEQDGRAIAAVLTGAVDPSGRLPLTFPARAGETPVATPSQYPGVDGVVQYREGLDVGYRWYLDHGVRPLFPFGFGLSYTTFAVSDPSLVLRHGEAVVAVTVRDRGRRRGTDVVEAYLTYPAAAAEPEGQLRAFVAVSLAAGGSRRVELRIARGGFEADLGGTFRVVPGSYEVAVGTDCEQLPIRLGTPAPR